MMKSPIRGGCLHKKRMQWKEPYRIMVVLLLATLLAPAAATAGQFFPDSRVEVSLSGRHMAYLGLEKGLLRIRMPFFS